MSKVVWVTSGRSTIGPALCQAFICQGYRVHVIQASDSLPAHVTVLPFTLDTSYQPLDSASGALADATVHHWLQRQEAQTGPVDTLLYVAEPAHTACAVKSLHNLLIALHASLCKRQQGRIVLVLPILHSDSPDIGELPDKWIRELAQQGLGQGVTVNVIRAGRTASTIETLPAGTPETAQPTDNQPREARPAVSPHLSQAQEIASLALWLASAEAASLTGAEFVIKGPT